MHVLPARLLQAIVTERFCTCCSWVKRNQVAWESVPDWFILLEREMKTQVPRLRSRFPRLMAWMESHRPDKMDNYGSITSLIYQHMELRCVLAAKAAAEAQLMEGGQAELVVGATINDGFLRQRLPGAEPAAPLPAHLLRAYEQAILDATGLRMQLAEKAWELDPSFTEPADPSAPPDGELSAACDYDAALLLAGRLYGRVLWSVRQRPVREERGGAVVWGVRGERHWHYCRARAAAAGDGVQAQEGGEDGRRGTPYWSSTPRA
jgi:hypothetical protein